MLQLKKSRFSIYETIKQLRNLTLNVLLYEYVDLKIADNINV